MITEERLNAIFTDEFKASMDYRLWKLRKDIWIDSSDSEEIEYPKQDENITKEHLEYRLEDINLSQHRLLQKVLNQYQKKGWKRILGFFGRNSPNIEELSKIAGKVIYEQVADLQKMVLDTYKEKEYLSKIKTKLCDYEARLEGHPDPKAKEYLRAVKKENSDTDYLMDLLAETHKTLTDNIKEIYQIIGVIKKIKIKNHFESGCYKEISNIFHREKDMQIKQDIICSLKKEMSKDNKYITELNTRKIIIEKKLKTAYDELHGETDGFNKKIAAAQEATCLEWFLEETKQNLRYQSGLLNKKEDMLANMMRDGNLSAVNPSNKESLYN